VRARHERGKLVLHSEKLIDWIIVPLPFLTFGLYLQKPIQHVRGKLLRRRLAIDWILAKLGQVALPPLEFTLLMRRRFVVELSIVTCDPELLHQTERGEYLRVIEENFGKNLFVKQVQTPWPKPNEIDQEYCDRDYDDCSNRAEPFENALKHLLSISVGDADDDMMRNTQQLDSTFSYESLIFRVHSSLEGRSVTFRLAYLI
jgi:hypothetical protein